jgi:hypothetical protein
LRSPLRIPGFVEVTIKLVLVDRTISVRNVIEQTAIVVA